MNRRAISKMLGVKLLPVSGEMTRSAKNMLDTEMEYIDYLRNRRKFFVMTNVMQQRVTVGGKKGGRDADGGSKSRSIPRNRRFLKKKKRLRFKSFGKGSKVGRFARGLRYKALRLGGAPGLGKKAAFRGPFRFLNPRNIAKIGVKIKDKGIQAGNKVRQAGSFVKKKGMQGINYAGKKLTGAGSFLKKKIVGGATRVKNVTGTMMDGGIKRIKDLWKRAPQMVDNAKSVVKTLKNSKMFKNLSKVMAKGGGRAIPVASMALSANDMVRYQKIGGWKGWLGTALAALDMGADATTLGTAPASVTGVGAAVPAIAQVVSQIAGWGLTIFELVQVLSGQDPYAQFDQESGTYSGNSQKGLLGFAEGGEVTRPTKAIIGEGGEGELVIPHSKMGKVMSSLFKEVGAMMLGITKGFLGTLPTPSTDTTKLLSEASKLSGLFPGGDIPKIFSGKKITNKLIGTAKRAFTAANPIAGLIMNILRRPVMAQPDMVTQIATSAVNTADTASTTIQGDSTMVSNFNITDYYGSTENRSRPHGGVDVATPVNTPVGFAESGEILAAGKYGGYGNMMDVWLPNTGIQMRIAHLSSFVKKSGEFLAGEVIAKTGGAKGDPGAGNSTGPHLHFEYDDKKDSTRYGGAGDPLPFAPLIKLGNFQPPSEEGVGGVSYGHPLSQTVKWPTSGGAMGGASFSPAQASGLSPNQGSTTITKPQVVLIPLPIQSPVPYPVRQVVTKKIERKVVLGVDPFSGKYGDMNG